ncbi:hypothetical protein BU15DRAFT_67691 [Melanogaster broomeanus]|nr:hypothetical protein BU15DRAFT_67691 [Melanogaster broomeanus]
MGPSRDKIEPPLMWIPGFSLDQGPARSLDQENFSCYYTFSIQRQAHRVPTDMYYTVIGHESSASRRTMGQAPDAILKEYVLQFSYALYLTAAVFFKQKHLSIPSVACQNVRKQYLTPTSSRFTEDGPWWDGVAANGTRTDETGSLKLTGLLTGLDYVLMGPSRDKMSHLDVIPGFSLDQGPARSLDQENFSRYYTFSIQRQAHRVPLWPHSGSDVASYLHGPASAFNKTRKAPGLSLGDRQNVRKQYLHPLVPIPRTTWWASMIHQVSSRHSAPARNHQQKTARVKMTAPAHPATPPGPPTPGRQRSSLPLTPPPPSPPIAVTVTYQSASTSKSVADPQAKKAREPVHAPRPPYKAHSQK